MHKEERRQEKGVRKKMSSNADVGNAEARIRNGSDASVSQGEENKEDGERNRYINYVKEKRVMRIASAGLWDITVTSVD